MGASPQPLSGARVYGGPLSPLHEAEFKPRLKYGWFHLKLYFKIFKI